VLHLGIVSETKAETAREAQRPGIIKGTEEDGRALAQIGERTIVLAAENVALMTHLKQAGKAYQGL